MANCGGGPEQAPFPGATVDSLQRDSLALLDSLRSQVDGWEAQVLEELNNLKVNCRVREDSLMANGQAMLEDSAFLLLRTEVKTLTDSLRHSILYGNTVADEAQVSTLEYRQIYKRLSCCSAIMPESDKIQPLLSNDQAKHDAKHLPITRGLPVGRALSCCPFRAEPD